MTHIRSLAPQACPACGTGNSFRLLDGQVRCARCGYINGAEIEGDHVSDEELDALFGEPSGDLVPEVRAAIDAELQRRRESFRPSYIVRDKSGVDAYAEAIFSTAMDHLRRKDWDGAIHHLRRAVDHNRDFTDAHLWLARLLPDETERRAQYKAVLSLDMQHGDALRELMIMDGELDASRPVDDFTMPEVRQAGTVAANSRGVKCPRCGAPKLDSNPLYPDRLICGACGHEIVTASGGGDRSVMRALLRKRGQAVEWIVGARVLSCNGCGAERTFAADQLAEHCPFCGSRNVITQDAHKSLTQPDAVVPFAVSESLAREQVREALASGFERLKGWFNDNRYQRITGEGVFLPYWVFDAAADVTRTYRIREKTKSSSNPFQLDSSVSTLTERYSDAAYNVLIPGIAQPPPWMLARIGQFDVVHTRAYSPEMIAQHGAELYTTDFDKASLEAHSAVSQAMRDKYNVNTHAEQTVSVFSVVKPISFRLLLLPVWAVTISERDGEVRPALVNGQTGKVALGKAAKPK
jgi:uncharacterized Zn finger protein (UPF0148 family)